MLDTIGYLSAYGSAQRKPSAAYEESTGGLRPCSNEGSSSTLYSAWVGRSAEHLGRSLIRVLLEILHEHRRQFIGRSVVGLGIAP